MNNNLKVLLNVNGVPGAVIHEHKKVVKTKGRKHTIIVHESIPSTINIKMTQDAYDYMTSIEKPYWYKGLWNKLSKKNRLELHLQRTCEDRGGSSFTYSILED